MDKIKTIEIDKELYCAVSDVLDMLKGDYDKGDIVEVLEPKTEPKEELSDFNKKLKKGLDFNTK